MYEKLGQKLPTCSMTGIFDQQKSPVSRAFLPAGRLERNFFLFLLGFLFTATFLFRGGLLSICNQFAVVDGVDPAIGIGFFQLGDFEGAVFHAFLFAGNFHQFFQRDGNFCNLHVRHPATFSDRYFFK